MCANTDFRFCGRVGAVTIFSLRNRFRSGLGRIYPRFVLPIPERNQFQRPKIVTAPTRPPNSEISVHVNSCILLNSCIDECFTFTELPRSIYTYIYIYIYKHSYININLFVCKYIYVSIRIRTYVNNHSEFYESRPG